MYATNYVLAESRILKVVSVGKPSSGMMIMLGAARKYAGRGEGVKYAVEGRGVKYAVEGGWGSHEYAREPLGGCEESRLALLF